MRSLKKQRRISFQEQDLCSFLPKYTLLCSYESLRYPLQACVNMLIENQLTYLKKV